METTRKCLCSTYLMGYDAWEVVLQQRIVTRGYGRVFPHNHRSVSAGHAMNSRSKTCTSTMRHEERAVCSKRGASSHLKAVGIVDLAAHPGSEAP